MVGDVVEPDCELQDLPYPVYTNIANALDSDGAWHVLAKELKDGSGRKVISDLSQLEKSPSPGGELLEVLRRHCCQVQELQNALEKLKLHHVLRKINTNDPVKIEHPKNDVHVSVGYGERHVLHTEASGSPYPTYQWFFNDNPLAGQTSCQLQFENFRARDVGEYTCKVKQGAVEMISHKYIISVKSTPPRIVSDLLDMEVAAYENLTLTFEIIAHPPPVCFKWFKNNVFICNEARPKLELMQVDCQDSGKYHCEVFNDAGYCSTRQATIIVRLPVLSPEVPKITKSPKANREYSVNDTVNLTCQAACRHPVKFTCFLHNEELRDTEGVRIHSSNVSDSVYECDLHYLITKNYMRREDWKPLRFKFEVASLSGRNFSKDILVRVKKTEGEAPMTAQNKFALLVANSDYQKDKLFTPATDIKVMAAKFKELGFRVMMFTNLKRNEFHKTVRIFSNYLQGGDYVSFFYAGHGFQDNGKDNMVPVDACTSNVQHNAHNISHVTDYISPDDCVCDKWVADVLQHTKPALLFSVYDMCRHIVPIPEYLHKPLMARISQEFPLRNSVSLFATSENLVAYELKDGTSSVLVKTLSTLMTKKIPVSELVDKVLHSFEDPQVAQGRKPQVPEVVIRLDSPRSLADPCQHREADAAESSVLQKWEKLASVGGVINADISVSDISMKVSIQCSQVEPRTDGVTWIISNSLVTTINLTQDGKCFDVDLIDAQDMNLTIIISTGYKESKDLKKTRLPIKIPIHNIQALQECLVVDLIFRYKGHQCARKFNFGNPPLSKEFMQHNYLG